MFPKDSAFKQYEDELAQAAREAAGRKADETLRHELASGASPTKLLVSRADLEEVYQRLNDLVELAYRGNMHHAAIRADELQEIRDLVYRNLP